MCASARDPVGVKEKSQRRELNPRPVLYKSTAIPLSHVGTWGKGIEAAQKGAIFQGTDYVETIAMSTV